MATRNRQAVVNAGLMALKRGGGAIAATAAVGTASYFLVTPHIEPIFTDMRKNWPTYFNAGNAYFMTGLYSSYFALTPFLRRISGFREGQPEVKGKVKEWWNKKKKMAGGSAAGWAEGIKDKGLENVNIGLGKVKPLGWIVAGDADETLRNIHNRKRFRWLPAVTLFKAAYLVPTIPAKICIAIGTRLEPMVNPIKILKVAAAAAVVAGTYLLGYILTPNECGQGLGSAILAVGVTCGYWTRRLTGKLFGQDAYPAENEVGVRNLPGMGLNRAMRLEHSYGISTTEQISELEPGMLAWMAGISIEKGRAAIKAAGGRKYKKVSDLPGITFDRATALQRGGVDSVDRISELRPDQLSWLIGVSMGEAKRIVEAAKIKLPPRMTARKFFWP